ncbi:rhomboid family intramembrane serine protease [Streptomyces xiamenensis]|jgi:membrane associated rhomboid family serine protease|uniref:Peptidase S54, rhomboid domain protein n=1 Tax=Streptomyces xiamenensis TaxID=408015 RepID=A0A0F7FUT9_9ACTN|nr:MULTISPECIES: rhomboid family intramembrane serine protease [Streptomyces]AKG43609.1 Peptidase S54, rhomboid domain protein [Streptomyces xiamenensis]QQN78842.1 rhomboid family intramembrane serine protease [Streptomyces sp. XC 2026]
MPYGGTRGRRALAAGALMLAWLGLLWILAAADGGDPYCLPFDYDPPLVCEYGIEPRDTGGLLDIYPAAFLHFGFDHLAANSWPLVIFGFLAALRGIARFLAVSFVIITVSGLGVWLTASGGSITAGASGVVFGLFGYLLARGFVERNALDITVGLTVFLLYGSLLWGVLPTQNGVSWQGHLFGLLGGVASAFWLRRGDRAGTRPRRRTVWDRRGLTGPPPGHPG